MPTLIEKAQRNRKSFTKQEVELARAWAEGDVSLIGVARAIDKTVGAGTYSFLARALAQILKNTK